MKTTAPTKTTVITRTRATPIKADDLAALQALPDAQIDYSDIPKSLASELAIGAVGRFYRPIKKPIYTNIDADVLAWLKSMGRGYQTRINEILRQAMLLGHMPRPQSLLRT
ncbi:MAG: hypothetical protein RL761_331 [Pseudomonadota bacterium]|jgi:uncharacterized protein (DUF4415 family)